MSLQFSLFGNGTDKQEILFCCHHQQCATCETNNELVKMLWNWMQTIEAIKLNS